MRALQLSAIGRPLVAADIAAPAAPGGQVVVTVEAAGICHSDVHYRSGLRRLDSLPVTLGHEVAGTITAVGSGVDEGKIGSRVALHYVISCGTCDGCRRHGEQFCERYGMLGVTRDGGFAEQIAVPEANAVEVPPALKTAHAAVMMCSTVTALHALHRGKLIAGEAVAVFGVGGLGMSGVQLAAALGARRVYAIDIDESRLAIAAELGADAVPAVRAPDVLKAAGGVEVAIDFVGSFDVLRTAIDAAPPGGRVVTVGLTAGSVPIDPFTDLIRREVVLIGSNDHTLEEVHEVFDLATAGHLSLDLIVTDAVPLEARAVNGVLDVMERYGPGIRTVVKPGA